MENTELKINSNKKKINKNKKVNINELASITCPVCLGLIAYQREDGVWPCPNCGAEVRVF